MILRYINRIKESYSFIEYAQIANPDQEGAPPKYLVNIVDEGAHRSRETVLQRKFADIMVKRYKWMKFANELRRSPGSDIEVRKHKIKGDYISIRSYDLTNRGAELRENLPTVWKFGINVVLMDIRYFIGRFFRLIIEVVLLFFAWFLGKFWDSLWDKSWWQDFWKN